MKTTVIGIILLFLANVTFGGTEANKEAVERACLNYIEGFYEGDTVKLSNSLETTLLKYGFWKKKGSDTYQSARFMTYDQAISFAKGVKEKKNFPKADAPKKVELLGISNKIAIAKVTAWWGVDYVLLAKNDGKWKIRQVLWEGPAKTASPSESDKEAVRKAGLGYIEGFYEGDASKLAKSLMPKMYKFGYGWNKKTGMYYKVGQMTYEQALNYAKDVKETKNFPKPGVPKEVEVLDVMNHIASVKVTAWWGVDYILLSKSSGKWMIEQVLWAGIPAK